MEPPLNSKPVDSVSALNSPLTASNSLSCGCTGSPPGATLNPKLSLYFGETQVNCPVIPPWFEYDFPPRPNLILSSFPS